MNDRQIKYSLAVVDEIDRLNAALLWIKENLNSGPHNLKEIEDTIDGVLRGEPHNDTYITHSYIQVGSKV